MKLFTMPCNFNTIKQIIQMKVEDTVCYSGISVTTFSFPLLWLLLKLVHLLLIMYFKNFKLGQFNHYL